MKARGSLRFAWMAGVAAVIAAMAATAPEASAKGKEKDPPSACVVVKRDLDKAQKGLDKATRTYEAREEALDRCQKKGGGECKKQKDGLEDARAAKAEADNAFKSAQRMVKKACTQECATAKQEFATAEQVAKAAAREAETLAEEIAECKKSKDKGCGEKKKDFDAAKKAKMKADATLKRATKHKDAVCAK